MHHAALIFVCLTSATRHKIVASGRRGRLAGHSELWLGRGKPWPAMVGLWSAMIKHGRPLCVSAWALQTHKARQEHGNWSQWKAAMYGQQKPGVSATIFQTLELWKMGLIKLPPSSPDQSIKL